MKLGIRGKHGKEFFFELHPAELQFFYEAITKSLDGVGKTLDTLVPLNSQRVEAALQAFRKSFDEAGAKHRSLRHRLRRLIIRDEDDFLFLLAEIMQRTVANLEGQGFGPRPPSPPAGGGGGSKERSSQAPGS